MANATKTGQALYVVQTVTAGGVILLSITTVLVIMVHKDLRRCPRNLLVMSLALSDLLTGSAYCAFYDMNLREVSSYLLVMLFTARVFNTAAIVYDSYIDIWKQFQYLAIMSRRCRFIIPLCWVVAVIINLQPLLCRNDPNPGLKRKISITFLLLLGIAFPYFYSCIAFFSMFRRIRKQRRIVICLTGFSGTPTRLRRLERKKTKVILLAVTALILALTGLPLLYYYLITPVLPSVSNFFILVGSLINALIYGFMNPDVWDIMRHRLQSIPIGRALFVFRSSRVAPSHQLYQLRPL